MFRKTVFPLFVLLFILGITGVDAGQKIKVGVIHLMADHPDHIQLRDNFVKAMKTRGYDVESTVFDAKSAQYPDTYVKRSEDEAKRMEAAGADLIFLTGVYRGDKNLDVKIPIIDSVFIAPILLGYAEEKNGQKYCIPKNVTGSIFGYSFKDVVKFIKDVLPQGKKVAYLYSPGCPISRPISEIEEAAKKVGLQVVACPFNKDKAEGLKALEKAVKETDIAFATNSMAVFGFEKDLLAQAISKKFPVIVGVVPLVNLGAVAAIQSDWARAGEMCAEKADRILRQGVTPNTIPITFPDRVNIGINMKTAQQLGIEIPFEWLEVAGASGQIVE